MKPQIFQETDERIKAICIKITAIFSIPNAICVKANFPSSLRSKLTTASTYTARYNNSHPICDIFGVRLCLAQSIAFLIYQSMCTILPNMLHGAVVFPDKLCNV